MTKEHGITLRNSKLSLLIILNQENNNEDI